METKSLVALFLVSCIFVSICFQPAASQGLRWGREYEEEEEKHRVNPVKDDYLRRKEMHRTFEDAADEGKKLQKKDWRKWKKKLAPNKIANGNETPSSLRYKTQHCVN